MNERSIPGSIPGAPTFGEPAERNLPGITCPDPAIYMDSSNASSGDIPRQRQRRRRSGGRSSRSRRSASRNQENIDRADRLQAALILARQRVLDPLGQQSPFDPNQRVGQQPNNIPFLESIENAGIQQQQ